MLSALLVATAWSSTAQAQDHGGFYLRLGTGLGYYSASADIPGADQSLGGMTIPLELLMGGTLMEGLVLGGGLSIDYAPSPTLEVGGMEFTAADISQYVVAIGIFADYYPAVADGWHGQLRVGWGGLETSSDGNVGGSDPTGLMLTLGGGYDYWFSGDLGVGGLLRFTYAPISLNDVDFPTIAFGLVGSLIWY